MAKVSAMVLMVVIAEQVSRLNQKYRIRLSDSLHASFIIVGERMRTSGKLIQATQEVMFAWIRCTSKLMHEGYKSIKEGNAIELYQASSANYKIQSLVYRSHMPL